jgi:hypothetical protein
MIHGSQESHYFDGFVYFTRSTYDKMYRVRGDGRPDFYYNLSLRFDITFQGRGLIYAVAHHICVNIIKPQPSPSPQIPNGISNRNKTPLDANPLAHSNVSDARNLGIDARYDQRPTNEKTNETSQPSSLIYNPHITSVSFSSNKKSCALTSFVSSTNLTPVFRFLEPCPWIEARSSLNPPMAPTALSLAADGGVMGENLSPLTWGETAESGLG